jgi:glycosyltransferase involved in cell wall biosynthesis
MKVFLVHNSYQQAGGEDIAVETEAQLLEEHGHLVSWYRRDNSEIRAGLGIGAMVAGTKTIWAWDSYRDIKKTIRNEAPDVVHFHNTFPLISPSAYFACADLGIPVVQTLHNYRLLCPAATCFREGRVCEVCATRKVAWPGIKHACYRNSSLATSAVAAMLAIHRALGTWQNKVDYYIALTDFARRAFIRGGLPANRIRVKPNSVHPDPGSKNGPGQYALFVGRLSEEKGVRVLMKAWAALRTAIPLIVAGDGPLREEVATEVGNLAGRSVKMLGAVDHSETVALMRGARFLVLPSLWYEACPLALIEAFACGLPVVGSRIGVLEESIAHGETGLHFSPGNFSELAVLCDWAWTHPDEMQLLGRKARSNYKAKYTAEQNYALLMDIYQSTIEKRVPAAADRERDLARAALPS